MNEEILKLVYNYTYNGKIVDRQYIDKLIEIVVKNRELNKYVTEVHFNNDYPENNENGIVTAGYNMYFKYIQINVNAVNEIISNYECYNSLFNTFEEKMFKNLIITQMILHELEHAYQNKILDSKEDSVENRLIKTSLSFVKALKNPKFLNMLNEDGITDEDFKNYAAIQREIYKKYYIFDPIERMAEIYSTAIVLKTLEEIKEYIPNLYGYENATFVEKMLMSYEESWTEGSCPTEVYLRGIRKENVWNSLGNATQTDITKLPLEKRMILGLPITGNEYGNVYNWLSSTNKHNV